MAARLLVSGFDPFVGVPWNPSGALALRLAERPPDGASIRAIVLPTIFEEAARRLADVVVGFEPTHVVALGFGAHPTQVRVERFAVNLADSKREDNAGRRPADEPVVAGGPTGYFATLPVHALVGHLREAGLDAIASTGAGTFVCNDLFYRTMHLCASQRTPPLAGFVHVPVVQGMPDATESSPTLEALAEGIRVALGKILP